MRAPHFGDEEWAYLKRVPIRLHRTHRQWRRGRAMALMTSSSIMLSSIHSRYYQPELDSLRGRGLERREVSERRRGIPDRRERGED